MDGFFVDHILLVRDLLVRAYFLLFLGYTKVEVASWVAL